MAWPSSVVLSLMMISNSIPSFSITRLSAGIEANDQPKIVTSLKAMQTFQVDPQVVRVEDLELADCWGDQRPSIHTRQKAYTRFEILDVLGRNLGNF